MDAQTVPANVAEARAWIAAWQDKNLTAKKAMLEKALNSDVAFDGGVASISMDAAAIAVAEPAVAAVAVEAAAPPVKVLTTSTAMQFVKVRGRAAEGAIYLLVFACWC